MEVIFIKGDGRYGKLCCVRQDASRTETQMPEQGIAPHDMIHYVVEKTLAIAGAFYGQLKAGANISFTLEHNQLSRQIADKTQVWQTESMVEALQSLYWSQDLNFEGFCYLLAQSCEQRGLAIPLVSEHEFKLIIDEITELTRQWQALTPGQSMTLVF
ncbi:cytoplasmic protein [Shewanella halotolerans]|uniref:cytoplasmic protein n=1 Tax=Shewanella halotolerans TaxID=2864204 RepID=UPI001C65CA2E|nr:cytoplasmic protein [Shewanella halotolerans]QYJ91285.1 cytoplasmic protein [Shewanella halotolerans]